MNPERQLLTKIYRAFNARQLETVLDAFHPTVDWPNGMEGGRVHGHQGVRDYWTRQWSLIDPHVEPLGFTEDESGRTVVEVHQIVRDLQGNVVLDTVVHDAYRFRDGRVERMDIE